MTTFSTTSNADQSTSPTNASDPRQQKQPAPQSPGKFHVVHVASAPRDVQVRTRQQLADDDTARAECIRRQKEELELLKQARHQAFVERHEDAVVSSVPLEVRLRCLLAEGRRYERERAEHRDDEPSEVRAKRMRYIDAGYKNLIEDVRRRSAVIAAHNPPAPHQHALGSEAIGCYSSMLPWTEGVVLSERVPAADSPVDAAVDDFNRGVARRRGMPPNIKARGASVPAAARRDENGDATRQQAAYRATTPEPASPFRWSIPQRLATDTRKLAAVTAARRKRLQSVCSLSPPGPSAADTHLSICRAQQAIAA